MKKLILIISLITTTAFAQDNLIGKKEISVYENGTIKRQTVLNPLPYNGGFQSRETQNSIPPASRFNLSNVRWSYTEPTAVGDYCVVSGNGKYSLTAWNLNSERVSFYGNLNSTPLWEFQTNPDSYYFVTSSDTGGVLGVSSYHNVYLFNNTGNVPFFNFDVTTLPDTGFASSLELTNDGKFLVVDISNDTTSRILGFNSTSNVPVWEYRVIPTIPNGGGAVQGFKMSGNDSLVIVNTYAEFFIIKTFTGELIYQGVINPGSPNSGTQGAQGINGDGSIIATMNYSGILRVYQWNGTTYNLLWQNQEPPGMYYNWYTAVDISYDGNYIAAGTLNFITLSTYDGKVKVFERTGAGTPLWTYAGCGDEVSELSFSKSGNILAATSYGEFNNLTDDLYIFKTFLGSTPIFTLDTPGSLFYCSTSNDGRTIVASGKSIHAREFGNGGLMYNIDVDTSEVPSSISGNTELAADYKLFQNYPNPFNPATIINYSIPSNVNGQTSNVKLIVYDILGNEVATLVNEKQNAGSYEVRFDGSNSGSGIYFYKLESGAFVETKKMILLK